MRRAESDTFEEQEAEVDGDATIVIPAGSIPSGTAHLKSESGENQT